MSEHDAVLERLRSLCAALPEVTEKLSHGSPTWFVKKTFVTWVDDHHGDGNTGIWCAAPPGAQEALVGSGDPRFFRPPYVGHRGWLGVRLVCPTAPPPTGTRSPSWSRTPTAPSPRPAASASSTPAPDPAIIRAHAHISGIVRQYAPARARRGPGVTRR